MSSSSSSRSPRQGWALFISGVLHLVAVGASFWLPEQPEVEPEIPMEVTEVTLLEPGALAEAGSLPP